MKFLGYLAGIATLGPRIWRRRPVMMWVETEEGIRVLARREGRGWVIRPAQAMRCVAVGWRARNGIGHSRKMGPINAVPGDSIALLHNIEIAWRDVT